eukprot:Tbor_TRINITY_DN5838_c2_g1::TRINITY_DN5838_c2_g1_i1::g.7322::m.7322
MRFPNHVRRMAVCYEVEQDSRFVNLLLPEKKNNTIKVRKAGKRLDTVTKVTTSVDTLSPRSTSPKWQYYNDFGGWSDFEPMASEIVEVEYANWLKAPEVSLPSVSSAGRDYSVDFNLMEQKNNRNNNHTVRKIRRV